MPDLLYICDPAKNKGCPKTGCKSNPRNFGGCEHTTNPAYAQDGVEPVEFPTLEVVER